MGNRVVVADIQESFHFVRYKRAENQLIVFADDTNPRWITAMCLLDYDTVAGADKFGNITVVSTQKTIRNEQIYRLQSSNTQAVCFFGVT